MFFALSCLKESNTDGFQSYPLFLVSLIKRFIPDQKGTLANINCCYKTYIYEFSVYKSTKFFVFAAS